MSITYRARARRIRIDTTGANLAQFRLLGSLGEVLATTGRQFLLAERLMQKVQDSLQTTASRSETEKTAAKLIALHEVLDQEAGLAPLKILSEARLGGVGSSAPLIQRTMALLDRGAHEELRALAPQLSRDFDSLCTAVHESDVALQKAEATYLREVTVESLKAAGFEPERKERLDGGVTIKASSDQGQSVFVEVSPEGTLDLDIAGYPGRECEAVVQTLEREFKTRGVSIEITNAEWHEDTSGGILTKTLTKELADNYPLLVQQCQTQHQMQEAQLSH